MPSNTRRAASCCGSLSQTDVVDFAIDDVVLIEGDEEDDKDDDDEDDEDDDDESLRVAAGDGAKWMARAGETIAPCGSGSGSGALANASISSLTDVSNSDDESSPPSSAEKDHSP